MARSRLPVVLAAAVIVALTVVAGAGAILVPTLPNPSFEDGDPAGTTCGALVPPLPLTAICGWNYLTPTTMTKDTLHHSGSYSMKLTKVSDPLAMPPVVATSVEGTTAGGVCISPIPPGPHAASFWYYIPSPSPLVDVQMGAHWYPNADCTTSTFDNDALHAPKPVTYGAWTQVTGFLTAPPTTGSAFFSFFASCQCSVDPGTVTAYFDDVAFSSATAVTLRSLTASRSPAGVRVLWRTGTEADTLGFHVYRSRGTGWTRVDARLIPTKGSVSGARYSFLDSRAPIGKLRYRLQAVGTDGSRTWYGRAIVAR